MTDKLKQYVCKIPFELTEIHRNTQWLCCPSWLNLNIRVEEDGSDPSHIYDNDKIGYSEITDGESLVRNWFSENATKIRTSVMDGSYAYCDKKVCPTLSTLINTDVVPENFIVLEDAITTYGDAKSFSQMPQEVAITVDNSCNLKCPSCRDSIISFDKPGSYEYIKKKQLVDMIDTELSAHVKRIFLSGSGEALYSKMTRDFLINLDPTKYPNLEFISLITNGQLLTPSLWNQMNASEYIKNINISIDAGTKHTYENVTRIGGKWDRLIENLKFISTIKTIEHVELSMVVSELNYTEMEKFYELMSNIFENNQNYTVAFTRHLYWDNGAYSFKKFKSINIFDSEHPMHSELKHHILRINTKSNIYHNFHDIIGEQSE